jgi:hypothetical protein
MNKEIRSYLSEMGRKGGKKSRRRLTPEQARRMVAVREAQKAYDEHRHQYFWYSPESLKINEESVPFVIKGLMTEGDRSAFEKARRIKRLYGKETQCH